MALYFSSVTSLPLFPAQAVPFGVAFGKLGYDLDKVRFDSANNKFAIGVPFANTISRTLTLGGTDTALIQLFGLQNYADNNNAAVGMSYELMGTAGIATYGYDRVIRTSLNNGAKTEGVMLNGVVTEVGRWHGADRQIGAAGNPKGRLHVRGGAGNSLYVEGETQTQHLMINSSGQLVLGDGTVLDSITGTTIYGRNGGNILALVGKNGNSLRHLLTDSGIASYTAGGIAGSPSTDANLFSLSGSFSPVGGAANFNHLRLLHTINQTATTGVIRAILVSPGLTNVQDTYTVLDYSPTIGTFAVSAKHYGVLIRPKTAFNGFGTGTPTSLIDTEGANGYTQLRVRTKFTPATAADANGEIGQYAWDDDFLYKKTSAGWKKIALTLV